MSRISRYVLLQLLSTFGVALLGMTLVLVFGIMAQVGLSMGLGLDAFFRLLPYALPRALRFAVPASILLSTCSVFGRMSADNEVIAAKSLGISPRIVLYPAFGLALLISCGMIWVNDVAITWGASGIQSVIYDSVEEVVFRKLRTERMFRNEHFSINVKKVVGRKLIGPRLEMGGDDRIVVEARDAEIKADVVDETLHIRLTDSTMESNGTFYANPGTHEQEIPLSQATVKDRSSPRISELGLSHISNEAVAQRASMEELDQRLAARAALQMVMGEIHQLGETSKHPDGATWSLLHRRRSDGETRLNRLHLEPWRRCAEGFSCLFVVMVGAPLSVRMRTTNFFTTFALCFFPVLVIYYPALQWAVTQAKDGVVPPYTVWIGNGILMLVGIALTRRIIRY